MSKTYYITCDYNGDGDRRIRFSKLSLEDAQYWCNWLERNEPETSPRICQRIWNGGQCIPIRTPKALPQTTRDQMELEIVQKIFDLPDHQLQYAHQMISEMQKISRTH